MLKKFNNKMICKVMGFLLFIEAMMLLCCAGVSYYYGEYDLTAFLVTALGTFGAGLLFEFAGKGAERTLNRRDGYLIVSVIWILFSLFGLFPYYLSGAIPNFTNAFFETMSGVTTTGATIIDNVEIMPHGILFWRSLTQWLGGLGIIFFTIAILPIFGLNGGLKVFAAEATGPTRDKLHPRIGKAAKRIWLLYFSLSLLLMLLLHGGGMSFFDSICHSFSTLSLGGFSTRQAGLGAYETPYFEYVFAIFMIASGINFSLLYALLIGKFKKAFENEELRFYLSSVAFFVILVAGYIFFNRPLGALDSFRIALFQVSAMHTGTGNCFGVHNYLPSIIWVFLYGLMLVSACSGSTSGGLKCIRFLIIWKNLLNEFKHLLHPNAVLPIRINKQVLPNQVLSGLLSLLTAFLLIVLISWVMLVIDGGDEADSLGLVLSSIANVGIRMGHEGAIYDSFNYLSDYTKWHLAFLMLLGRLELFAILIVFVPRFWQK